MSKYHNNLLPCSFDTFFNLVFDVHRYNTRSAAKQSYCFTESRTNCVFFIFVFKDLKFGIQSIKILRQLPSIDLRRI